MQARAATIPLFEYSKAPYALAVTLEMAQPVRQDLFADVAERIRPKARVPVRTQVPERVGKPGMDAFSQSESLGSKDRLEIIRYLLEIGDDAAAKRFSGHGGGGQALASRFFGVDQWANTGILLGYIADRSSGSSIDIQNAVTLAPDDTLKGGTHQDHVGQILRPELPADGAHTILCEFTGKNQISGGAEEMRFALTTTANDRVVLGPAASQFSSECPLDRTTLRLKAERSTSEAAPTIR